MSIPNQSIDKDGSLKIHVHELACLSMSKQSKNKQSHTCSLNVYLGNIRLTFFILKMFDDLCKWVFNPEGRHSKSLILRYWSLIRSKSILVEFFFWIILDLCFWFMFVLSVGSSKICARTFSKKDMIRKELRRRELLQKSPIGSYSINHLHHGRIRRNLKRSELLLTLLSIRRIFKF